MNDPNTIDVVAIVDPVVKGMGMNFDAFSEEGLPETLRVGLRYRRDSWDIELDYSLARWSAVPERRIWFERFGANGDVEIDLSELNAVFANRTLAEEFNDRDISAVSLGGSLRVHDYVTLRLGGLFQERATDEESIHPAYADATRWAIAGGFQYDWGYLTMDMGVMARFDLPTKSEKSQRNSINTLEHLIGTDLRTQIGDGEYSANALYFIFGIEFKL